MDYLLLAEFFAKGVVVPMYDILGVTPARVALGNHHVEDPLAAFFLRLDQAKGTKIEQVALNKANFLFAHPASLQVESQAGEMR